MQILKKRFSGVIKNVKPVDIYIDIKNVKELLTHSVNEDSLILGANMPLTETMNLFYKLGEEHPKFSYLTKLADHIDVIANVPVRNVSYKNYSINNCLNNISFRQEH